MEARELEMSGDSILILCGIALPTLLWLITHLNSKRQARKIRGNQVLRISIQDISATHPGLRFDPTSIEIDGICSRLSHAFVGEILSDSGALLAKDPNVIWMEGLNICTNMEIVGKNLSDTILRLKVPIFRTFNEFQNTKILVPEEEYGHYVFEPMDWEEMRNRLEKYVKGKNYDPILKINFSNTVNFEEITADDENLAWIIKSLV